MDHSGAPARHWAEALGAWAIPDEILAQAPTSPWIHPVECFTAPAGPAPDSPSHALAREALPDGGTVLDVGCGGGRAAFALVPPAARVVGVDTRPEMLDRFAASARERGVVGQVVLGTWPDVAQECPDADVVTCHHVVYNVADVVPFVRALDRRARRRVVLELPERHPLAHLAPYWRGFWGLERPDGPTADDLVAVLADAGLPVRSRAWLEPQPPVSTLVPLERQVEHLRIRLCLPADRDEEVAAMLGDHPPGPRRTISVWWDVSR